MITAELGKHLSEPVLDIKGLSIKKTNVCKTLRTKFTEILENDILKAENIDLVEILKKYDALEDLIAKSLSEGKTEFAIPKNTELIANYKAPDSIEAIRGLLLWNALEPELSITPPEKVNIIKLRPELLEGFSQIPSIQELRNIVGNEQLKQYYNLTDEAFNLINNHLDKAVQIAKVIFNIESKNNIDISRFGLSVLSIPKDLEKIPGYIIPFIDFKSMQTTNMTNGYILLESLGIFVDTVKTVTYKSNIISL